MIVHTHTDRCGLLFLEVDLEPLQDWCSVTLSILIHEVFKCSLYMSPHELHSSKLAASAVLNLYDRKALGQIVTDCESGGGLNFEQR